MCSFAQSPDSKLCKSSNITPSSSSKLHPNPSVPIQPHTKTKLHTKPRSISNSPRKMIKKNARQKFFFLINFFLKQHFSHFWRGGPLTTPGWGGPPPGCTIRRRLAGPRRWRESAYFAARAPLFELCIVTGLSTRIIHLNFKNSSKIEI